MAQTIKVVLRRKDKLVLDLSVDLQANSEQQQQRDSAQLVAGSGGLRVGSAKAKQRFHLRNHVHYGHQVNLGHQHTKSARVNKRHLLRSPELEQPSDLLEQVFQNRSKMIELHAF